MAHLCLRALPASQQATECDAARAAEHPISDAQRTIPVEMEVDQHQGVPGAAEGGTPAFQGGHAQLENRAGEASQALSLGRVEELAVSMFVVGADKPMAASRALAGASGPTVGLAVS